MNLRDADLRFLLPAAPGSVVLLDATPGIAESWRAAGVAVLESRIAKPDLVVAPTRQLSEALHRRPAMLVLRGRSGRRGLESAGYQAAHLLALPSSRAPRVVVPIASRRAIEGALSPIGRRQLSLSTVRRSLGRLVLRFGWAPSRAVVTVAARDVPQPWLLRHVDGVSEVESLDWYLWFGDGDPLQRAVLHVPSSAGGWALKFSRVTGNATPFRNEERAARASAQLPVALASHVPQLLSRGVDGNLPYVLETRFPGRPLTEVLLSSWSARRKFGYVERVAKWLRDVAMTTRTAPGALTAERERLTRIAASAGLDSKAVSDVMSKVERVPGVLVHNDPGSWNIVVDRRRQFGLVDWESSRDAGMPLWDLTYFLADALTLVKLRRFRDRTAAILELFRGESPYSNLLFRHVRQAVADLSLEPVAVGPLVSMGWLHHSQSPSQRRERLRTAGAEEDTDRGVLSVIAKPWLSDPALGFGWSVWQ